MHMNTFPLKRKITFLLLISFEFNIQFSLKENENQIDKIIHWMSNHNIKPIKTITLIFSYSISTKLQ